MQILWPICSALGFTLGLARLSASTVVPNRCAKVKKVSPDCTLYAVVLGGQGPGPGAGPVPLGIQILCPICSALGLTFGFACRIASTVVPNRCAKLKNVSPDLTLYAEVLGGQTPGAGPGAGPVGMQICWPTVSLLGSTAGLAAWRALSDTPWFLATLNSVSPLRTV